jgi:hypothetical protein
MPAEKTQSFCPCSRNLNRSSKGLNVKIEIIPIYAMKAREGNRNKVWQKVNKTT